MRSQKTRHQTDAHWLLHRRDLAPEEFAVYLIEWSALVLRQRLNSLHSTPPVSSTR